PPAATTAASATATTRSARSARAAVATAAVSSAAATAATIVAAAAAGTLGAQGLTARHDLLFRQPLLARQDVALIDPDLDSDIAVGGRRLGESVVDIRAKRMQRNLAVALVLAPSHLGPVQPAGAHHADSLDPQLHRAHDRLTHGALVGDSLADLLCD